MSRPIAIANYDFRASGTVLKSIEIAGGLVAAGIPAELWVFREEGALRARVPAGVEVVALGSRLRAGARKMDMMLNLPIFAGMLRERRPAVLLSGGNHLHFSARYALELSGMRNRIRLGMRASNSSRRPLADGSGIAAPKLGHRGKYAGADFIAAVCAELAEEIRTLRDDANVVVVPNGVDTAQARRLAAEPFAHRFLEDRTGPVLVSVGRITRQKGFDLLIRALPELPGARLLIVGEGKAAQEAALADIVRDLGLADRVDFLGFRENPFAIVSRCDLYVAPSRWEGSSNALLEALACGLPIVATDVPTGNREIVGGGLHGTLAPPENPSALAAAILTELAAGRAPEAQRRAADALAIGLCLERWVRLLDEQRTLAGPAQN